MQGVAVLDLIGLVLLPLLLVGGVVAIVVVADGRAWKRRVRSLLAELDERVLGERSSL